MRFGGRKDVTQRSRALRKQMSPTEWRLWRVLKTSPGAHRFRKQHPCEEYTLDFFCAARGLVIEVDGESHNRGNRPACDVERDARLAELGLATLRIPAVEVSRNLEGVALHIVTTADERPLLFSA